MTRADLTRTTFAVLVLVALTGCALWILRPFLGPAIWAAMIVVTTWKPLLRLQARLGGRRWAAVAVMSLLLVLLFALPLTLMLSTIVDNAGRIAGWLRALVMLELPPAPPHWLATLPLVGERIVTLWAQWAEIGVGGLLPRLQPYAAHATRWFVAEIGSIGFVAVQALLTLVIAAVMYATGETCASYLRRFACRLAGQRGQEAVELAGEAIRGVALGVGVTAIVQAVLGGIGLALAGVPFAGLATALMFLLCLAQVGVVPVLLPATVWTFWNGDKGWGIFLVVWTVFVAMLDNVLRPILIRMGAELPLLLIFAGVIGGLVAFGLVGIFVGPVILAVAFRLLENWIDEGDEPAA